MEGPRKEGIASLEKKLERVHFVDLWFVDLLGIHRQVTISKETFLKEVKEGVITKLDGSSVYGFASVEESDLNLAPDLSRVIIQGKIARIFCFVLTPNGKPHPSDPRYLALATEQCLREKGLVSFWGPEPEFFVFNKVRVDIKEPWFQCVEIFSEEAPWSGNPYALGTKCAYYRTPPSDSLIEYRCRLAEALAEFGIEVVCHHHEVATAGQIEINIRHGTLLRTADAIVTLKYLAKKLAKDMGMVATFMPKPLYGDNGSGMHTHQNLFHLKTGENLFHDEEDEYAMISQTARDYIGGLLEHGRALAAIVAPTVNSYRRLVPGYEAPVYLVWGKANRSAAVRIPAYNLKDSKSKRVEFRPPDPSCNPYLAFIAMLAAGLDGIQKKIDPGDPVDRNVYEMSPSERRSIRSLPRTLLEALDELECDNEFLKPFIPSETLEKYIEYKRKEAIEIELRPSPMDYVMYLNV